MKDLYKQLNNLKDIKADEAWKESNRSVLLGQISASESKEYNWFKALGYQLPAQLVKAVPHSAVVTFAVIISLIGGGAFSIHASQDTKPGDSLYIAKLVSEKTQLALTFNEKKKVELNLEFASERAKELNQVLEEETNGKKEEKVEKLLTNFKKEIASIKNRVVKITKTDNKPEDKNNKENTDETAYFSANMDKDENGISTSESVSNTDNQQDETVSQETNTEEIVESTDEVVEVATSTDEELKATSTKEEAVEIEDDFSVGGGTTKEIMDEAKELLEKEDYNNLLTKIDEAEKAVESVDYGDVKGETEEASSTESVVIEEIATGTVEEVIEVVEEVEEVGTSTIE